MRMERMVWVWMFCGSSGGVVDCWHDMIEADLDGSSRQGTAEAGRSGYGVDAGRLRRNILARWFGLAPGGSMARIGGKEVWLDWGGFACLTCACCWFLVRCAGA